MARRSPKPRSMPVLPNPAQPQEVRRAARSGPSAVMPTDWPDPEDIRPNASRSARRIHGWSTYDPIRIMAADPRSGIEAKHVYAASKLRELADVVTYGFSGDWLPIFTAMVAAPRLGLRPGEKRRVQASRRLSRLWPRFTADQQRLLIFVVLQNHRVADWVRLRTEEIGRRCDPQGERRLLVGLLGQIWKYFETEISHEVDTGRRQQV